MKTSGKTITILAVSGVIFAAAAYGIIYLQSKDANALIEQKKVGKSDSINSLIAFQSPAISTFVSEYSARDEVVSLMRKKVPSPEPQRISLPLNNYKAYAAVVYGKDFSVIATALNYSESVGIVDPEKVIFSSATMAADIEKNKISHSFSVLDGKPVEIFVSAIYPKARARTIGGAALVNDKPAGYLLAMKVWDSEFVSELSKMAGAPASLKIPGKEPAQNAVSRDIFAVKKDLLDLEGKSVAAVEFSYPLGEVKSFTDKTLLSLGVLVLIAFLTVLIISSLLFSWTIAPLKKMVAAFRNKDAGNIEELKGRKDEFGEMGRLIGNMMDSGAATAGKNASMQKTDELKTPLASVKEAINILTEELADELNDEQSSFLSLAKRNAEKMETILNSSNPGQGEPNQKKET